MTWMSLKQAFRFCVTLLIYISELLLLLYSVQLLVENSLGIRPFSAVTECKLVKPFFDFLWSRSSIQWLNAAAMQVAPKISKNAAIGELMGAIGVGGVFVTTLTGATEQRICGVRTGELLNWLHIGFFWAYALLFLPLVLLGIFAGHAKRGDAAIYAFFGVFLGLLLVLWAFSEVVLSVNQREKLALRYYVWQIRPGMARRLRTHLHHKATKWSCISLCHLHQKNVSYDSEYSDAYRAMLSVADYLRNQAEYYHRNISTEMIRLWIYSCQAPSEEEVDYPDCSAVDGVNFKKLPVGLKPRSCYIFRGDDGKDYFKLATEGGFPYPDNYLSNGQDYIIKYSILARDIWSVLLPGEKSIEQDLDLTIICQLLHSLYQVSEPDKRRFIVLLGLLFCLEDKAEDDDVRLIKWVDDITKEGTVADRDSYVPCEARHDLVWALLMIRIVAWIQNGTAAKQRESIDRFCQHFGTEFHQCDTEGDSCDWQECVLLWYAEWAARKRRRLSLNDYLLGISTMLGAETLFPHFRLDNLTYRKQVLTKVLASIYPWRDKQDEKGELSGNE